jgi:8-oxo-dGTP diphosphatase
MSQRERSIEVLARGVYVRDGHLLVCHTAGADNTYLPGGHVEFRESAPQSLVREVREELGLRAVAGTFLGAIEHTFRQKGEPHCEINLVFAMRIPGLKPGEPVRAREGHLDFRWVPLSGLGRAVLEPAPLRALVRAWARGQRLGAWVGSGR